MSVPLLHSSQRVTHALEGIYIYKADEAPRYPTGHFTNAAFLLMGAVVALVLRVLYQRRNKVLSPAERPWLL